MGRTPSAWAKPEHTPAPKPENEPLVIEFSELVPEDQIGKDVPTSPKGFIKLARENGWKSSIKHALARTSTTQVESWGVWAERGLQGVLAIWEKQDGEVAESNKKWSVSMAYDTSNGNLQKMKVTDLKNIIKEKAE